MRLLFGILSLAVIPALSADSFTLDPVDGALIGLPGQTLGWGLTIQNNTPGWLVVTSVTYDQATSLGDFVEFVTPQFLTYALAPNQIWTEAFDPIARHGLGSYVIDGGFALPGDMATGNLDLLFDIHSIDPAAPNYDPGSDTVTGAQVLLPATVSYPGSYAVPEPATITQTFTALVFLSMAASLARRRLAGSNG